jgi:hypothetical protein
VQPDIDGLFNHGMIFREMAQRCQGLLQVGHRLLIGRALGGLDTRLTIMRQVRSSGAQQRRCRKWPCRRG